MRLRLCILTAALLWSFTTAQDNSTATDGQQDQQDGGQQNGNEEERETSIDRSGFSEPCAKAIKELNTWYQRDECRPQEFIYLAPTSNQAAILAHDRFCSTPCSLGTFPRISSLRQVCTQPEEQTFINVMETRFEIDRSVFCGRTSAPFKPERGDNGGYCEIEMVMRALEYHGDTIPTAPSSWHESVLCINCVKEQHDLFKEKEGFFMDSIRSDNVAMAEQAQAVLDAYWEWEKAVDRVCRGQFRDDAEGVDPAPQTEADQGNSGDQTTQENTSGAMKLEGVLGLLVAWWSLN